jgi:hypothetical protein
LLYGTNKNLATLISWPKPHKGPDQGQCCQMVYFYTKSPYLGSFRRPWNWKYWYPLIQFGIFCRHLSHFMSI